MSQYKWNKEILFFKVLVRDIIENTMFPRSSGDVCNAFCLCYIFEMALEY